MVPLHATVKLAEIVDELEALYGPVKPPYTQPFDIIIAENAAYLVDDAKRLEVFRRLANEVGIDPEQILEHKPKEIEAVIADGGMLPAHRTEKVMKAARLAVKIGLDEIDRAIATDVRRAKKLLKQFPGVGDPLADRILLFSGVQISLAPDSNALRVLHRLGYGEENERNYTKSYKSAFAATANEFASAHDAQRAHLLLRRHGQELCKRSAPRCEACPLRRLCAWYQTHCSV